MLRVVLFVAALAFLLLGGEGLYHLSRARRPETMTCERFARGERPSLLVRVTGCEIDYSGAAYRDSAGRIQEVFLPARPAGRGGPVPIVAVADTPAALAAVQRVLETGRPPSAGDWTAAMRKAAAAAGVQSAISGLIRSGALVRFTSRRTLSRIKSPLAQNVSVVDLGRRPDPFLPGIQFGAGMILVGVAFAARRRRLSTAEGIESADRAHVIARLHKHTEAIRIQEEGWRAEAHSKTAVETAAWRSADGDRDPRPEAWARGGRVGLQLPAMMLLNMADGAGDADIETAPPLGPRAEVIARLRRLLPQADVDATGRWTVVAGALQLDLGEGDIVHTVVLEAAGETGISMARSLIESTGWRAFVPKRGCFVNAASLHAIATRLPESPQPGSDR